MSADLTSNLDRAAGALTEALMDKVRADLRAKILKAIEPDIRDVIESALRDMKPRIQTMIDHGSQGYLVRVLGLDGKEVK